MQNKIFVFVLFLFCFCGGVSCFAVEAVSDLGYSLEGNFLIRPPNFGSFVMCGTDSAPLTENTILAVKPNPQNPLATGSEILFEGRTIYLYPGASVRLCKGLLLPITGRFKISGEGVRPMVFANRFFELRHVFGEMLIEITPDSGIYIAMKSKKGDAFVRCRNHKIFDFAKQAELFVPVFGEPKLSSRLSSFWGGNPSGFSAVRLSK